MNVKLKLALVAQLDADWREMVAVGAGRALTELMQ